VLKVRAVDMDTGQNGNVTYALVRANDQTAAERFQVERQTGVVRTADVFDREAQIGVTDYRVTVKAEEMSNVHPEGKRPYVGQEHLEIMSRSRPRTWERRGWPASARSVYVLETGMIVCSDDLNTTSKRA